MADQRKIAALRDLIETKEQTEKEILRVAQEAFPVGDRVHFSRCGGEIDAIITGHNDVWWCHPRFRVENLNTGKEYWVPLYTLLQGE